MTYCFAYNLQLYVAPILALALGAQPGRRSAEARDPTAPGAAARADGRPMTGLAAHGPVTLGSATTCASDVQRYPASDPLHGLSVLLQHLAVDLVVDVGANDGGYATALRELGYRRRIVSFEPLAEPFARLSERAGSDGSWDVVQCALGDQRG